MKYVVTWFASEGLSEEDAARSLEVFAKWAPSEGVNFEQFLGRVDGRGGFAVVTTDDPSLLARTTAIFGAWYAMEVTPVLEIGDSAAIEGEAVEFRAAV